MHFCLQMYIKFPNYTQTYKFYCRDAIHRVRKKYRGKIYNNQTLWSKILTAKYNHFVKFVPCQKIIFVKIKSIIP